MTDDLNLRWLVLRLERDLTIRAHLKILLAEAETSIALRREDVRAVKARIREPRRK